MNVPASLTCCIIPPGAARAGAAMPEIAAARCAVHCFAAHASINSPLPCGVLDGEWRRLQNVDSLALTLRQPLHEAHATAQQGPTGKRPGPTRTSVARRLINLIMQSALRRRRRRAVRMNEPTAMLIDQVPAHLLAGVRGLNSVIAGGLFCYGSILCKSFLYQSVTRR